MYVGLHLLPSFMYVGLYLLPSFVYVGLYLLPSFVYEVNNGQEIVLAIQVVQLKFGSPEGQSMTQDTLLMSCTYVR